ncbi:hypothetical protein NMG60_11019167 [Bertholletia excelsa]
MLSMALRSKLLVKHLSFELETQYHTHPISSDRIAAFSSSSLFGTSNASSNSNPNLSAQCVDSHKCGNNEDEHVGIENFGAKKFRVLSSCDRPSCDLRGPCDFDDPDEDDDSEEADDETDEYDYFRGFKSLNTNQQERENFWSDEGNEDEFRHPLVKEISRLVNLRSAWTPKLEGELRHLLRSLKPRQVCAVLRSQADQRVALKFFYWADRQWRYRHDLVVYYAMLEVLSKTKLCQGARRVLHLMLRRGIECQPEAFGYLMISYSRAGNMKKAMGVLHLMQKAGVGPNLSLCNSTIKVLVRGKSLDKALRFLNRMQTVGIEPNVVSYNCLIKGYCELRQFDNAMHLIAEMPLKGCFPDKVSYYIVMTFLVKEKKIKEVRDVMEKMVNDTKLLPDQLTYSTLIHLLSKQGHGEEALEFLKEAEGRGFLIGTVGYSAIIHSLCQEGRIDKANELVKEMLSKGCNPDVVTYTSLIHGYCHIGEMDTARNMLQQMYKCGCLPNTISYNTLLSGLCKNGKSSEAREILKSTGDEWWTPDAITYSALMHGFRREGKLSEACDIVKEMLMKGFYPTSVEINLLIQSLCREGRTDDAKKFMEDCLHKGCVVNVVNFTSVIHGFCQKDDLEAALSLLDDMYLTNRHPDVVTYTAVINTLGRKGRIEEAIQLTNKMLNRGMVPSPVTYRSIIHWFSWHGRVEDLLKLLEKMLSRKTCRTAYNQVIEKLCRFGELDEAYSLLGKVLRTASRTDANTCHVLMASYLSKGIPMSSYKVARRMFNRNLIPDLKLCREVRKSLMLKGLADEAEKLMLQFVDRGLISPEQQNAPI